MLPLRVVVADDHRLFRQGLISLMNTRGDLIEVVGEAATGYEAISLAEKLHPDVVLMDLQMPGLTGLQATAYLREAMPDIAILILTASESNDDLYRAIRLGAAGYLLKSLDADELFDLICGLSKGEAALTRAMASRLLKQIAQPHTALDVDPLPHLSEREIEVLRLVAQGATNPQIAEALCITVNTVKVHLRNLLDKLCLENRTQIAAYAVRSGLVPITEGARE